MSTKKYNPVRLIYILSSIIFYIFYSPKNIVKQPKGRYSLTLIDNYEDISSNTFIIVDYSMKYLHPQFIKKCLTFSNVGYLKINNLSQACTFTKLGFNKLEGIYYFKNKKEIIDILDQKILNFDNKINYWDVYILTKIFEIQSSYKRLIGSSNSISLFYNIGIRFLIGILKQVY